VQFFGLWAVLIISGRDSYGLHCPKTAAMTPQELEQLSKPQLIEIILQLQARIPQLEEQLKLLSQPPRPPIGAPNQEMPSNRRIQKRRRDLQLNTGHDLTTPDVQAYARQAVERGQLTSCAAE